MCRNPQGNKPEIANWKDTRYQLVATKAYPFIAILVDSEYLKRNRKEALQHQIGIKCRPFVERREKSSRLENNASAEAIDATPTSCL